MRVLYTGADGYIGAILGPKLLARGYDAVGVDAGFIDGAGSLTTS